MTFTSTESYIELERLLTMPLKDMREVVAENNGVTRKNFSPELDAHISSQINTFCNHVEESVKIFQSKGEYIIDLRKLSRKISEMADEIRAADGGKRRDIFHSSKQEKFIRDLKTEIDNWIGIVLHLPATDLPYKKGDDFKTQSNTLFSLRCMTAAISCACGPCSLRCCMIDL